ncbi:MAG: Ryanodine receptor Ryr [Paludibacteraceae bacterium]|nr:Ryanodine receptor Ryr [Paludibacteraceae bacterium]
MEFALADFLKAWHESRNYLVRVLRSIDDYEPHPLNLEDVPLTDDLQELQEAIAENAHEVWAAARKTEGWTYGPVRNDALKHHPDLIPYSALPDSEKEYDRLMAFNTIKLVKKLGWKIVK